MKRFWIGFRLLNSNGWTKQARLVNQAPSPECHTFATQQRQLSAHIGARSTSHESADSKIRANNPMTGNFRGIRVPLQRTTYRAR